MKSDSTPPPEILEPAESRSLAQLSRDVRRDPDRHMALLDDPGERARLSPPEYGAVIETIRSDTRARMAAADPGSPAGPPGREALSALLRRIAFLHRHGGDDDPPREAAGCLAALISDILPDLLLMDALLMDALLHLIVRFAGDPDPVPADWDEADGKSSSLQDADDATVRGRTARAAAGLCVRLAEQGMPIPVMLRSTLLRLATDLDPGVRMRLLASVPAIMAADGELGWRLFRGVLQNPRHQPLLWPLAETVLLEGYRMDPVRSAPHLRRLLLDHSLSDPGAWADAAAAAQAESRVPPAQWEADLRSLGADVWPAVVTGLCGHLRSGQTRAPALQGLKALTRIIARSDAAIDLAALALSRLMTESVDVAVEIAYTFMDHRSGAWDAASLEWFCEWLLTFAEQAPRAGAQLALALFPELERGLLRSGRPAALQLLHNRLSALISDAREEGIIP